MFVLVVVATAVIVTVGVFALFGSVMIHAMFGDYDD